MGRFRAVLVAGVAAVAVVLAVGAQSPAHADDDRFYLHNANSGGPADVSFRYATPDDREVVGDWNGSGASTVGVRRGNRFLLRNANRGGAADLDFRYGLADDTPVIGDWNGDGTQTVGVRRGSRYFVRNTNTGGPADLSFYFGRASDTPIVGDWNGDGRQTVGVRRGARFFLRNSNTGGPADLDFLYGRASDVPIVGDWNGDGVQTIGVRRGSTFYLRNSNTGGPADLVFRFGRAADRPLVGDWNASGQDTIGVRRVPPPPPPPAPQPEVVSSFTTALVPGQARNTNIRLALEQIDGQVIAPGATWSLDRAIGPRTYARGYVDAGIISGGRLVSGIGGGISQVATTTVNAAWFSGIDIVRFRQHSIYFTRYPMCREATIATPTIDVVLRNDSPYPIRIDAGTTSISATVSFVSFPWARVSTWTSQPSNVVGGAFSVSCGRTVTYPDGSTSRDSYSWRYNSGYPG